MLLLLRHGQSTTNAEGLLVGRTDAELTELGRTQAAEAGALLPPVATVLTSPLRRATATAALAVPDRHAVIEERLVEMHYGVFDGRRAAEVSPSQWQQWRSDPAFAPEGGESVAQVHERVRTLLEELFATHGAGARDPDAHVLAVSHVSPIKAAVAWALGGTPEMTWRMYLANASVTAIGFGPGGPSLRAFNLVAGAPGAVPASLH